MVKISFVGFFFPQDCSNGFQKVFVMKKRVGPLISASVQVSFHKGEG